jgi:hypothetical protein
MIDTASEKFFGIVYQRVLNTENLILEDMSILTKETSSKEYTFFNYFDEHFKNTQIFNNTTPLLIAHLDGNIIQFEKLIFDADTVDYLNSEGLDIYIYEVPLFYQGPEKKNLYINLGIESNNITFDFPNNKKNLDEFRCFEFDSIEQLVTHNSLTNVTCHVLDYKNAEYCQSKYPSFKIKTNNFFFPTLLTPGDNAFSLDIELKKYFKSELINKKFVCLNWRYTTYRQLAATYVSFRNSICSWAYNKDFFGIDVYFDIHRWKDTDPLIYKNLLEGNEYLKNHLPLVVDVPIQTTEVARHRHTVPNYKDDKMFCPMSIKLPVDAYSTSFCAVVTESEFYRPTAILGEKTLNAIKCGRPFILVAPPKSLEYLHLLGFKTFNDFWDESYDDEIDHEARLKKIFKLIDTIDSYQIDDLQNLYEKMKETVEHNFNMLSTLQTTEVE